MNGALERFSIAVKREPLDLAESALLLGELENAGPVDVAAGKHVLDELAAHARSLPLDDTPWELPRVVARAMRDRGFRGNSEDYYDPANSFLHRVLERRLGIPISLGVLFLEVSRRVGAHVRGVGFPGHFLVRAESASELLILDPFQGGREPSREELELILRRAQGPKAQLEDKLFAPVDGPAILTRMLFNLAGIYGQRNDWNRSLGVLERLALLHPDNPRITRELGVFRARAQTMN